MARRVQKDNGKKNKGTQKNCAPTPSQIDAGEGFEGVHNSRPDSARGRVPNILCAGGRPRYDGFWVHK